MEIKHRNVAFDNNPHFSVLRKAFYSRRIQYEYKPNGFLGTVICYLSDTDPNYDELKPLIYHEHVLVQTGLYYSQKDMNEAEWLTINTSESQYPQGDEGKELSYLDMTYDLTNYCSNPARHSTSSMD